MAQGGYDQETVHTLDCLAYAYLQTAQDRAAKGVVDEIASLKVGPTPNLPIAYAIAAIPARYALERRDWAARGGPHADGREFPLGALPLGRRDDELRARARCGVRGRPRQRRGRRSRELLSHATRSHSCRATTFASPHLPWACRARHSAYADRPAVLQQFRGQD